MCAAPSGLNPEITRQNVDAMLDAMLGTQRAPIDGGTYVYFDDRDRETLALRLSEALDKVGIRGQARGNQLPL